MKFKCFFICFLLMQQLTFAQTANDIQIHDTRDSSSTPNMFGWYSPYVNKARFDFKYNHVIGSPGAGTYSTLLTIPQWPDNSGGRMHQLGFNEGGIFFRQGWPSNDSWGTWRKILCEDEYKNVGIGTEAPLHPLDINYTGSAKYGLSIANQSDNLKLQLGTTSGSLLNIQGKVISGQTYNLGLQAEGGNLGIGTSSPSSKLEVLYAQSSTYGVTIANSADNLKFKLGTTSNGYLNIQGQVINSGNTYNISLQSDGGNVGIGLTNPSERLSVNGNVKAKKIIVSQSGWPDYVFDSSYSLRTLSELEKFISKNKHLPEMPSAKEVEDKGVSVGDSQALLLKKIEELTLYLIQMKKEIADLKNYINQKL